MPPSHSAESAAPSAQMISPAAAHPTHHRRVWRVARPFLVLAGELVGYAAILYLAGLLMVYLILLRDGGALARLDGKMFLSEFDREIVPLAIMLVVVEYLTIAIHELGHALAARLMGYRFGWLRVEGFVVRRTPRGLRLGVSDDALLGGSVHCPPYRAAAMRPREIVYILGGPLTSLLGGGAAWLVFQGRASHAVLPFASNLNVGLSVFALVSGVNGVLNLVPLRGRRMYSDGWLLLRALLGGQRHVRSLALDGLRGCVRRGERPRAWPAPLMERTLALADLVSDDPWPALFAYCWMMDHGEPVAAGTFLDAMLGYPFGNPTADAAIALEAAFYLARYRGDTEGARARLVQGGGSISASINDAVLRPRAEAALALLEGHPAKALALAEAGLAAAARLSGTPAAPNVEMEADGLRELADLVRVQLATSPAESAPSA